MLIVYRLLYLGVPSRVMDVHVLSRYSTEGEGSVHEVPFYCVYYSSIYCPFLVMYVVDVDCVDDVGSIRGLCPYFEAYGVRAVGSFLLVSVLEECVVFGNVYCNP